MVNHPCNRFLFGFLQASMIILLLLGSPVVAEESYDFDTARSIANFMEDHYGVTILIGDECNDVVTGGFEIEHTPVGRTPLLNLLSYANYTEEIELVDDCFSVYPGGFFEHFKCDEACKGLRVLLPNRIVVENSTVAGVTTIQDGYYNIILGIGAFNNLNVHHEIWHAIELRITYDYPDIFAHWDNLNPEGFQYSNDYFALDVRESAEPKDAWFVRGYSVVNDMEDRATVIEAVFEYDSDWWDQHPYIKEKRDFLLAAARPVFGNIYFYEQ